MATKYVHAYENGNEIRVEPPVITLRGCRDRMDLVNNTDWKLDWTVPPGPFTVKTPRKEQIAKKSHSTKPRARRVRMATAYTVVAIWISRGKTRRSAPNRSGPHHRLTA
jgi:hypothetical protein